MTTSPPKSCQITLYEGPDCKHACQKMISNSGSVLIQGNHSRSVQEFENMFTSLNNKGASDATASNGRRGRRTSNCPQNRPRTTDTLEPHVGTPHQCIPEEATQADPGEERLSQTRASLPRDKVPPGRDVDPVQQRERTDTLRGSILEKKYKEQQALS